MGWIASFAVAILTSVAAMFGAGAVASLVVDWYSISSFEGGSGFFVIGMALVGALAGFVIGLVVARIVAARARPSFVKGLGASVGTVAVILATIAGASYVFADIAPTIDGEELFLLTELRWPASGAPAPASMTGVPNVQLGALRGNTARKFQGGLLFTEDARQEDGRWIVPGVVPIFTRRGGRLLEFSTGAQSLAAFLVPLPRYPGKAELQWSRWLPAAREGEPALPDQFTYRFKVIRRSESLRTESIGPFEVDTIADNFYYVSEGSRLATNATFRIRYKGQPIAGLGEAQSVAVIGGAKPALLVAAIETQDGRPCALVAEHEGNVRVDWASGCGAPVTVRPLTSDHAQFIEARTDDRLTGWVDRVSFSRPGLFLLDAAIVDTRNLTTRTFLFPDSVRPDTSVPPLDLSPDEHSFAWVVQGADEEPRLGVTNWRTGESYVLPIDRARMRFNTASALDPGWVRHHFQWMRGANGTDVLTERSDFVVLPYRGDLALGKPGEHQGYTLRPGGEALRAAVVELLVRDVGGERLPDEPDGFQQRVKINGRTLNVSVFGSYVSVLMDAPAGDPQAMSAIAAKLDAALASGKYDALFVADERK